MTQTIEVKGKVDPEKEYGLITKRQYCALVMVALVTGIVIGLWIGKLILP